MRHAPHLKWPFIPYFPIFAFLSLNEGLVSFFFLKASGDACLLVQGVFLESFATRKFA